MIHTANWQREYEEYKQKPHKSKKKMAQMNLFDNVKAVI